MPVLVKYSGDYADEFDCEQFCTFEDQKSVDGWLGRVKNKIEYDGGEFWFGTNESCQYDSMDDFMSAITIVEISNEENETLYKLFGNFYHRDTDKFKSCSFGTGGAFI